MNTIRAPMLGRHHRFTVDEFYRMAELGILPMDTNTELIWGEILDRDKATPLHGSVVMRMSHRALLPLMGTNSVIVGFKDPIRIDAYSEPVAEVAILRFRDNFYEDSHPGPADTLLIIEVAATGVEFKRHTKAALYGGAGIPEYWLVDLTQSVVLLHTDPTPQGYRSIEIKRREDRWTARSLPALTVDGKDVIG